MINITIVDDSHVDRMLVAGLLRKNDDYRIRVAENGRVALKMIADEPPQLVITDLIMPQMDGFELVCEMNIQFPNVPVILMTAYGNESIAVKALEAGAASYVPKAQQADRLLETVQRVLARAESEQSRARLAECVTEFHCQYALDHDPTLIPPLIDEIQQRLAGACLQDSRERVRVAIALEEALLNAVYHGNPEMETMRSAEGRWGQLAGRQRGSSARGRKLPARSSRRVLLDAHINAHGARFVVRDDGPGFDLPAVSMIGEDECFVSGRHRGMMLMRSLMDDVQYNDTGNEVTLVKRA